MSSDSVRPLRLAPTQQDESESVADEAMDIVTVVLRSLAQTARDTESAAVFEAWARHLLVVTPAPSLADAPPGVHQWSHARSAASVYIRREATAAIQEMSDMNDVVWAVIENTARIVEEDAHLDQRAVWCIEKVAQRSRPAAGPAASGGTRRSGRARRGARGALHERGRDGR